MKKKTVLQSLRERLTNLQSAYLCYEMCYGQYADECRKAIKSVQRDLENTYGEDTEIYIYYLMNEFDFDMDMCEFERGETQ